MVSKIVRLLGPIVKGIKMGLNLAIAGKRRAIPPDSLMQRRWQRDDWTVKKDQEGFSHFLRPFTEQNRQQLQARQ